MLCFLCVFTKVLIKPFKYLNMLSMFHFHGCKSVLAIQHKLKKFNEFVRLYDWYLQKHLKFELKLTHSAILTIRWINDTFVDSVSEWFDW